MKPNVNNPWPSYLKRSCRTAGDCDVLDATEFLDQALAIGEQLELRMGTTTKTALGTFNLPAVITCPGATEMCIDVCYGPRSMLNMGIKTHTRNYLRLLWYQRRGDLDGASRELESLVRPWHIYRTHGVGDFFSQFYVNAWTKVFRENRKTTGFAYTRSFELEMAELAALPNFTLWASLDFQNVEAGVEWSKRMGAKRAYMMLELAEQAGIDPWFQCPEQTGKRPDCAACGACFAANLKPKRTAVAFDIHSAPGKMLDYYRNQARMEAA